MNVGLLVIGSLLLLFLLVGLIIFLTFRNMKNQALDAHNRGLEMDARAKQAVWAGATIVSARPYTSAEEMRESVRVDLTLQIQPPSGDTYIARTTWRVKLPLLAQFQSGQPLSVKIDRTDPTLIFPNQTGAEYWL